MRPGGKIILIETLGTGYEEPYRKPSLANYLAYLDAHGFQSTCVRTDYCFASLEEERELVTFFFDDPMSDKIKIEEQGVILPGVYRHLAALRRVQRFRMAWAI